MSKIYEITIADKRHDTATVRPKHGVGDALHISNLRLLKGTWHKVNEWWFLKNKDVLMQYASQGRILIRMPDGSIIGYGDPAPVIRTASGAEEDTKPESTDTVEEQTTPLQDTEDDFSIFQLREAKVRRLREVAPTYAAIQELGISGLIEQARLTQSQAERIMEIVNAKLGSSNADSGQCNE
jgi:hypothetical protein